MNDTEIRALEAILEDLKTEQAFQGVGKRYYLDHAIDDLRTILDSANKAANAVEMVLATRGKL
jgi:uncharacterized protein Yka (UPF0111/DUF47 family)